MTDAQIVRSVERALAILDKIEEAVGEAFLDYDFDDIARGRAALREAVTNRTTASAA